MALPTPRLALFVVVALVLAAHTSRGAEDQAVPERPTPPKPASRIPVAEPDSMTSSEIYWVQGDTLVLVEQELAKPGGNLGILPGLKSGPLGPKEWIELRGVSSGVAIPEAQPRFRVAWDPENIQQLRLAVLRHEGDLRRTGINSGKKDVFKDKVPLTIRELRAGLYELTPKRPLDPGEYGIGIPQRYVKADLQVVLVMVADFTIQASSSGK